MGTKIFVIVGVLLQVFTANAAKRIYFDVDGPILYAKKTSVKTPGVFGTKVRLFKIRNRPNTWVELPNTPDVIEVSINDIDDRLTRFNIVNQKYESLLSPGEGRFGLLQKVKLNGIEFIPGFYHIKIPESFEYFHDGGDVNHLLEAYKNARELDRQNIGTYKGRYFAAFQELMSTSQEEADSVGAISSRSHTREEWSELQDEMIKDGEIKFKMDPSNIHMVGRASDYQENGIEVDDIDTRKVDLLYDAALELAKVPTTDAEVIINPNGDGEGKFHVLHYIENDQRIFMMAVKKLRARATMRINGNRIPVKIILSNAGDDWDVEQSRLPRHIVIGSNGRYRAALAGEISDKFFEADGKKVKKESVESVERKLEEKKQVEKEPQTGVDSLQCSQLFL